MTVEPVAIRDARDDDGRDLCALIGAAFAEYEGVFFLAEEMPELRRIASAFREQAGAFWVAHRGARLVGCVGWTPVHGEEGSGSGIELKKLYVARDERQAGLGAMLVERVEAAARERKACFIELWSDIKFRTAHGFYAKRGYVRDGRTRPLGDVSETVEYHFRKELD